MHRGALPTHTKLVHVYACNSEPLIVPLLFILLLVLYTLSNCGPLPNRGPYRPLIHVQVPDLNVPTHTNLLHQDFSLFGGNCSQVWLAQCQLGEVGVS